MPKEITPEQLAKKQRLNLLTLCNRIASAFSFKTIKTWEDVYAMSGTPSNPKTGTLTYAELKEYFASLKAELERNIATRAESSIQTPAPTTCRDTSTGEHPSISLQPKELKPAIVEKPFVDESGFNNASDYGLPTNHNFRAFLFWFQKKAVKEILDGFLGFDVSRAATVTELRKLYEQNKNLASAKRGMVLLAATGTGKTFIAAAVLRYLYDIGFHEDKTLGHTMYLYVTRATIVEQTKRVFESLFCLSLRNGVEVLNIEQLRSRAGEVWIRDEIVIHEGRELRTWKWKAVIAPCVVLWDESQALKNDGSLQNEIACAYNNIKSNTFQLFISATPFTRICEAKCFCVATRKRISDQLGLGHETTLCNENWPTYASSIAFPADPADHNEAAVERLVKDMEQYIVRVRGVRPQFDAINGISMIRFKTAEEQQYYNEAWERYLKEKAKLEAAGIDSPGATGDSHFQILVQFLKFRMAAEYCRREHLAELLYNAVQSGRAGVAALNFKGSIIAIVRILCEKYGVKRDDISLVWGGGQTALTKKQKMKAAIKAKAAQLEAAGIDASELLEEMALDEVEERILEDLPKELRLDTQSKEERQREIDRFQSGRSHYCLYTFRAGGVGLSLHHTDELTRQKVRRQKNGYAVVDDIPSIPVRPRINFVAPTYSAIELVQGLGRCPRLTSLSNTEQTLIFYRGTIEDDVARIVSQKLRCLSKVVRQKEKWEDVVVGGRKAEDHIEQSVVAESGTNYDDLNQVDNEDDDE